MVPPRFNGERLVARRVLLEHLQGAGPIPKHPLDAASGGAARRRRRRRGGRLEGGIGGDGGLGHARALKGTDFGLASTEQQETQGAQGDTHSKRRLTKRWELRDLSVLKRRWFLWEGVPGTPHPNPSPPPKPARSTAPNSTPISFHPHSGLVSPSRPAVVSAPSCLRSRRTALRASHHTLHSSHPPARTTEAHTNPYE